MKNTFIAMLSASLVLVSYSVATASITYYTDQTTFENTFSGLVTETFDNGTGATGSFSGPLNSLTNNSKFETGDIVEGIEFSVSANGLHVSVYGESKALGCQQLAPGVTMTINLLEDNIAAFGMNVVDETGYAPNPTIKIYDTSDVLLDTWTGAVPEDGSIFFGVSSSDAIGKITIWSGPSPTIDNVSFAPVPEPGTIALLVSGLIGMAIYVWRRKM